MIKCPKCGQMKEPHPTNKHICVDCSNAIDTRVTYRRQHNDWLEEAREQGLDTWLQQPGETQWEYTVWTAYRDSYPGKKPSYGAVALQLNTTYNSVRKIAQRWTFQTRMQLWMIECDRITMIQRRTEILDMNKAHVDMATIIRNKLQTAVDLIDPLKLKPGEIVALAKMSAEMERKARVDTIAQEEMRNEVTAGLDNPELKKTQTKQNDMSEIIQILLKAGALGANYGIKETTTVEVVVKDEPQ